MLGLNPLSDAPAEFPRKLRHFLCLLFGYRSHALVTGDVAFLAEAVKLPDQPGIRLDGARQRLDDIVVVGLTARAVARGGKRGDRRLEGGSVSEAEARVRAQGSNSAVRKVTISDRQYLGYLLAARLVLSQPPAARPVLQAHLRLL